MRRRILPIVLVVLILIATGFAGFVYSMIRKNRGPPPPKCELAALTRRTFEAPKQLSFPDKATYHLEPSAALLSSGELVAVYNARTWLFGESWLQAARLGLDGKVTTTELKWNKTQYFDTWVAQSNATVRAVWLGHNGGLPEKEMETG